MLGILHIIIFWIFFGGSHPPIFQGLEKRGSGPNFQPQDPCNPLEVHPHSLAGEEVESKLTRLREAIFKREGGGGILLKLGEDSGFYIKKI